VAGLAEVGVDLELDLEERAPRLDALGLVSSDLPRSLAFYRRLGIDLPDPGDGPGHVEATLPGGLRLMWDTEDVVRSFDPGFRPGSGGGAGLAFLCDSPAEVDAVYADLVGAGEGELVMVSQGSTARMAMANDRSPVDAAIIGILDSLSYDGELVFRKA